MLLTTRKSAYTFTPTYHEPPRRVRILKTSLMGSFAADHFSLEENRLDKPDAPKPQAGDLTDLNVNDIASSRFDDLHRGQNF